MPWLVQIAVGAAMLSFGSSLWAAEIRWFGEASCRRELEVSAQIESMTDRPVSTVEIADFELRVKSMSKEQWSLELTTLRRPDGVRSARVIRQEFVLDGPEVAFRTAPISARLGLCVEISL